MIWFNFDIIEHSFGVFEIILADVCITGSPYGFSTSSTCFILCGSKKLLLVSPIIWIDFVFSCCIILYQTDGAD